MFAYCNNNPVIYTDSSGNFPVPAVIIGEFLVNGVLGGILSYGGAALTAKISGEEFNKGEAFLWALADGLFAGFSAVCSPVNVMRIRYLQVSMAAIQGIINGDELWEIALAMGLTYSTNKVSSTNLGTAETSLLSLGADAVEGVVDVGKQNASHPTITTNPTYKNSNTSTKSPSSTVNRPNSRKLVPKPSAASSKGWLYQLK